MKGSREYYTQGSKSDKEINIIWYHIYVKSKNNIKNYVYKIETDSQA